MHVVVTVSDHGEQQENQLIKSLEKKLKLAEIQPARKKTNAAMEEKSVAHPLTDQVGW